MKKNTAFLIVGKTRCGKDTVAKHLKEQYDIPPIVSYTTRPIREYEVDGREHYFVSKEKMNELKNSSKMIAYTINDKTGIEYCATVDDVLEGDMTYIINPNGIRWMQEYGPIDRFNIQIIHVIATEEDILRRAEEKGDNIEVAKTRLESEREEFDEFHNSFEYENSYFINNCGSPEDMITTVDDYMNGLGYRKVLKEQINIER